VRQSLKFYYLMRMKPLWIYWPIDKWTTLLAKAKESACTTILIIRSTARLLKIIVPVISKWRVRRSGPLLPRKWSMKYSTLTKDWRRLKRNSRNSKKNIRMKPSAANRSNKTNRNWSCKSWNYHFLSNNTKNS